MTSDFEDRSTWARNKQVIRRDELLRLIEGHGGPQGLDLRGAIFVGNGPQDDPEQNPIDLSPEALAPLAQAYQQTYRDSHPPWLTGEGTIYLRDARLQAASLIDAKLRGARLMGAQLQEAVLTGAQLQGAQLDGAQLQGAYLGGAQLQGAWLMSAQLQEAYLRDAQLQDATLWRAELQGAFLGNANLEATGLTLAQLQDVDLYIVKSLKGARWDGALLDHTRIKREALGKRIGDEMATDQEKTSDAYHKAKEAYLLLKNNFNQIGRYDDASWAYVKEQQMEKMAYYWEAREHGWRIWRAWSPFQRWLRNWTYELTTGYGERPWNAVGLGAFIMAAFALVFWATRTIENFWDALIYSLATFATFNLGPSAVDPQGRGVEIASSIEALLGIGVLALVVFTLGNRMSRG